MGGWNVPFSDILSLYDLHDLSFRFLRFPFLFHLLPLLVPFFFVSQLKTKIKTSFCDLSRDLHEDPSLSFWIFPFKEHLSEDFSVELISVGVETAAPHSVPNLNPLTLNVVGGDRQLDAIHNADMSEFLLVVDLGVEDGVFQGTVVALPVVGHDNGPFLHPLLDEGDEDRCGPLFCQHKRRSPMATLVTVALYKTHNPNVFGCRMVALVVLCGEQFTFIRFHDFAWPAKFKLAPLIKLFERQVNDVLELLPVTPPGPLSHARLGKHCLDSAAGDPTYHCREELADVFHAAQL